MGASDKDLEARVSVVEYAVGEIRDSVKEIASAVRVLANVEVKHEDTRDALGRAFTQIKEHDKRITAVETALPPLKEARGWAVRGMLAVLGLVGLALIGTVLVSGKVEVSVVRAAPVAQSEK